VLAFGVVCALLHAQRTGRGQVVDAAIVDGVAALARMLHTFIVKGTCEDAPGVNHLDGGAPFYDTYACADGKHVAVVRSKPHSSAPTLENPGLAGDPACGSNLARQVFCEVPGKYSQRLLHASVRHQPPRRPQPRHLERRPRRSFATLGKSGRAANHGVEPVN